MLSPPSLATGCDVGSDGKASVNAYNAIIPRNESNVNTHVRRTWQVRRTLGQPATVPQPSPCCPLLATELPHSFAMM